MKYLKFSGALSQPQADSAFPIPEVQTLSLSLSLSLTHTHTHTHRITTTTRHPFQICNTRTKRESRAEMPGDGAGEYGLRACDQMLCMLNARTEHTWAKTRKGLRPSSRNPINLPLNTVQSVTGICTLTHLALRKNAAA